MRNLPLTLLFVVIVEAKAQGAPPSGSDQHSGFVILGNRTS